MKILVTGSSGLIGSAVVRHLTGAGHFVLRLVRSAPQRERGDVAWEPVAGRIERQKLEDLDAVIHLAGENLLGLWTRAKRDRLYASRVTATDFFCETLSGLQRRPRVLIAASAIGYYGHRGATWLNESSPAGAGFLAELCADWERATELATRAGIRVVNLRAGIVLSPAGGALRRMLPIFKSGLAGPVGMGRHYMSWIALDDAVTAIQHILKTETMRGPVNLTTPHPVTNREFTATLARVLHRPAFLPVPSPLLRLLPGRMAREMLLASQRAAPDQLIQNGYEFQFPELEDALRHMIP